MSVGQGGAPRAWLGHCSRSRCHTRGQAFPLLLFVTVVALVYVFGAFDVARTAIERQRLANAADAAAFSAMQGPARAMNTLVYTNRAMIANEVAIAQAIGLASWTDYLDQASKTVSFASSLLPTIAPFTDAFRQTAASVSEMTQGAASLIGGTAMSTSSILANAQSAVAVAALDNVPGVLHEVVLAHDDRYELDAEALSVSLEAQRRGWARLVRQVLPSDTDAMARRVDLIERSLDDFSRDRSWNLGAGGVEFAKRGATRLVPELNGNGYRWLAKDLLAWRVGATTDLPLAWGIAHGGARADGDACEQRARDPLVACGGWYPEIEHTERLADTVPATESRVLAAYDGPAAHYVLADDVESLAPLRLFVRVGLNDRPSEPVRPREFAWFAPPGARPVVAAATSTAELYYRPPVSGEMADGDSAARANAYLPYWGARLVDPDHAFDALSVSDRASGRSPR